MTVGVRVGVDVGTVRVGLAVSDPHGIVATPVETVARAVPATATGAGGAAGAGAEAPTASPADVVRIATVVREHGAVGVYVGLPRHLSGAEGSAAQAARAYAGELARVVHPVPVRLVDERMSTVSAHRALREAGRPGRRHRAVVDQVAAVTILQAALEQESATGRPVGELVAVPQHGADVSRARRDEG